MSIFSNSLVITPQGKRQVSSLSQGDYIYNIYGAPTKIIGKVCSVEKPFILTLMDNRKIALTGNTLLPVYKVKEKEYCFETVENISKQPKSYLVRPIKPVELARVDLPFTPYGLGFFLRSGDLKRSWNLNKELRVRRPSSGYLDLNEEVINSVAEGCNCELVVAAPSGDTAASRDQRVVYTFKKREGGKLKWVDFKKFFPEELNPDRKQIKIPTPFLRGSVEQRYELLAGLVDSRPSTKEKLTSGTSIKFEFSNNPFLGGQVTEILASLGINYEYKLARKEMYIHLTPIQYRDLKLRRRLRRFEEEGFGKRHPSTTTGYRAHHIYGEKIRSIEVLQKELPMTKLLTPDGTVCAENYIGIYEKL